MTEGEHTDDRTEKRGTHGVPRFIVALGVVGAVALVAAVVAVALNWGGGSGATTGGPASVESTQDAMAYTEGAVAGEGEGSSGTTSGPSGSSAAELAAQSAAGTEADIAPCADGETLPVLGAPPASTIGLIALPADFDSAQLEVVFSPYGWGQGGPSGCNLVISVESAQPASGDTEGLDDISGTNASVWVECAKEGLLETGGQFTGTVEVRRQGNVGVLFLTDLSRS